MGPVKCESPYRTLIWQPTKQVSAANCACSNKPSKEEQMVTFTITPFFPGLGPQYVLEISGIPGDVSMERIHSPGQTPLVRVMAYGLPDEDVENLKKACGMVGRDEKVWLLVLSSMGDAEQQLRLKGPVKSLGFIRGTGDLVIEIQDVQEKVTMEGTKDSPIIRVEGIKSEKLEENSSHVKIRFANMSNADRVVLSRIYREITMYRMVSVKVSPPENPSEYSDATGFIKSMSHYANTGDVTLDIAKEPSNPESLRG